MATSYMLRSRNFNQKKKQNSQKTSKTDLVEGHKEQVANSDLDWWTQLSWLGCGNKEQSSLEDQCNPASLGVGLSMMVMVVGSNT